MFRFAAGGVGGAANKNDRKFLGFAPREQGARGRGASVIRQNPADFARNTFELRPIHTAKKRNRILEPKRGRAFGATPLCPFLLISNFGGGGEIRNVPFQYHGYFSAEKFRGLDSLASTRSVFAVLHAFALQPDWIFCLRRRSGKCSIGLRILHGAPPALLASAVFPLRSNTAEAERFARD